MYYGLDGGNYYDKLKYLSKYSKKDIINNILGKAVARKICFQMGINQLKKDGIELDSL
ncbi:MAG: hypothetical protein ACOZF2_15955 [Thermodesulfobacteriota bacterium]